MFNMIATIELTDLAWSSDWNGYEVGYPDTEVVGLYTQVRDDGHYSYYLDMDTHKVLDFWKDEMD